MNVPKIVALDTETCQIAGGELAPALVCVSVASRTAGEMFSYVVKHDCPTLEEELDAWLCEPEIHLVGANIKYDMAVLVNAFPRLWGPIWAAYEAGRIHDVQILEKLKTLSTTGDLAFYELPDGSTNRLRVALDVLEKKYLGVDRSEDKKGPDAWRNRYGELRDVPIDDWPAEARQYPLDDAVGTLLVYEAQQKEITPEGSGSAGTEAFQAASDFSLWLTTAWGMVTDPERVEKLGEALEVELNPRKMAPLYEAGLVRPAEPPRAYVKDPNKFTVGKEESVNKKALQDRVATLCAKNGLEIKMTPGGVKQPPQICTADSVLSQLVDFDPIIKIFQGRQELIKIQTTYLPVLQSGLVHFVFDVLKESGRTSSKKSDTFPSANGQNLPQVGGTFSVRECYVARPGHLIVSCDYSQLELCAVAQTTYSLFGESVHREKINAGYNLHDYLGAQLAAHLDDSFAKIVDENGLDPEQTYKAFIQCKKSDDPKLREFYKHYRTFAKPTGLGYPGGLGADRFVEFARSPYEVIVDRETAQTLKSIWLKTYPEMARYFRWVNSQADPQNVGAFSYSSPLGMYRAGIDYCSMANGKAMQTPSAEGAKTAHFNVTRACFDSVFDSILFGGHPVDFVHDEILVEIPDDEYAHERAMEVSRLMVGSMTLVMPDVTIKAEPCLMRRWYKEAEPSFDTKGRLVPWEPTKAKAG